MSLTVIAVFDAARGKEDALRTALEAMIEPSLEEPGCLAYQPYVDPSRPGSMVIIEEWTGRDALERHFGTPHFRHVARELETLLSRPFSLRHLTDAGTPPAGQVRALRGRGREEREENEGKARGRGRGW